MLIVASIDPSHDHPETVFQASGRRHRAFAGTVGFVDEEKLLFLLPLNYATPKFLECIRLRSLLYSGLIQAAVIQIREFAT